MSNNNTGKTVATLLIGAAVGSALGYIIGTDKEKRQDQLDALKEKVNTLKDKLKKTRSVEDIEDEIFNA